MDKEGLQEKNIPPKIRDLLILRVLTVTFLLGMAAFIEMRLGEATIWAAGPATAYQPWVLLVMILSTYLLTAVYYIFSKSVSQVSSNIYFQGICDVLAVTALVFITGGIDSVYSLLYTLIIIYCVLFLGKRGGVIIASASSIAYGLLLDLAYYEIINPLSSSPLNDYYGSGYVFTRIFVHIISFYIVALIASFLVERERRASSLLAERETAFEQLDLLHRSIIESVNVGILTINLRGLIKTFNRAAEEITGEALKDVRNRRLNEVFPAYKEVFSEGMSSDIETKSINREMEFIRKDLEKIILSTSLSILKDSSGKELGEIMIFQDITRNKMMEEDLERSKRLAFIGEMASGLAHEIRNPLAALSGSIQLLQKNLFLTDQERRLMDIVLRGKEQLESFMQDFLLFIRPLPGNYDELAIGQVIEETIESLRLVPDWHEDIDIGTSLLPGPKIKMKKTELRQIVWNLLLNAVQALPGPGRLTVATEYRHYPPGGGSWVIRVRDNGIGIDKADLKRVLEPFYTKKPAGTGLGLAIVNRIVSGYEGSVSIESETQKGTTVEVQLPCPDGGRAENGEDSRR